MRRLLINAIAAFVAVLFLVVFVASSAFAAGIATWSGNNLSYSGNTYNKKTADGTMPPGLTKGADYYLYEKMDASTGTGEGSVIYFDSGANTTTADSANYEVFTINDTGSYSSKPTKGPEKIDVAPKALSPSSTQAAWNGTTLDFDGHSYAGSGSGSGPIIADGKTAPVLTSGIQYYTWEGPASSAGTGLLHVIYFPSGVDVTTAVTATYTTFNVDDTGKVGSQTSTSKSITVVPLAQSPLGPTGTGPPAGASTCNVTGGIGWIVCPVSNFLADGMDRIFELLKGFMLVEPISTKTDSPLYQAWNLIRGIANIAFVIAFLVIIYSQITGAGITNYGLKKLMPRLIVAALLVNISYFICAIAVDLSNVAGVGLQQILVDLRTSLDTPNTKSIGSWESVTGFILADTAVTAAAAVTIGGVILSSGGSLGAALILLLPMLLGLILAVLVALIILAARQALIVILIIVSPLAFVAYLLPNTENLFEKWRSIFITMLVFFPIFALVFGGSQFAAFLIIQTAEGPNAINVILLAMFVQVAPLVLTPLLIKFSGGIIGRIAGFVNDPRKGLVDRTRNWAKEQSEYMAARNMARRDPVRRRQVFRRFALTGDQMKRAQQERLAAYKEASDARWTGTQTYSNIQQDLRYAQDEKAVGTEHANLRYETSKTVAGRVRNLDFNSRDLKLRVENAKELSNLQWESNHAPAIAEQRLRSRVLKDQIAAVHSTHDAEYEEFKRGRVGHFPATAAVGAMLNQSRLDTELIALNAMRSDSAKRAIQEQFTKDLEENTRTVQGQLLQNYAGGVQGIAGAQRALASAISAQSSAHDEAVKNAMTILSHGNFDDAIITELALGRAGATGITLTEDMRLAAITKIASGPNTTEIVKLMAGLEIDTSDANQDLRQTFSETLSANSNKPKFAGAGDMAAAKQGRAPATGPDRLFTWAINAINGDKYGGADRLVSEDKEYLVILRDAINNGAARARMSPAALATIKQAILHAQTDPQYKGRILDRKTVLQEIYDAI